MSSYLENAKGNTIEDIKDDVEFQTDLVRFLSSSRKNYSVNELRKKGTDFMIDEYVEHMRAHDVNEATVLQDVYFARDENAREKDKAAYGKLMLLWDTVEGAGTGKLKATGDYLEGMVTAPSNLLAVGTGGFTKLGTAVATQALRLKARKEFRKFLSKEFAKGFARSAAVEGAIGYGMIEGQEAAREATVEDYEGMSPTRKAISVGVQAGIGGTLGGLSRTMDSNSASKAIDIIDKQAIEISKSKLQSAKKAVKKLADLNQTKAGKDKVNRILDRMSSLNEVLAKRKAKLEPLDVAKTTEGLLIKDEILKEGADKKLTSGLSRHTLQSITGATLEIVDRLDIKEGERISSVVARAIENNTVSTKEIDQVISDYGLSREEFSYIFLSDLSEAGRTLGEAGRISQAVQKNIIKNMEDLADQGISIYNSDLTRQVFDVVGVEKTKFNTMVDTLKGMDSVRIAFMTSQLGTTAANTLFSTARLGIDVVDEVFRQTLRTGGAAIRGDKIPISNFNAVTSGIRALTLSKTDAKVLRLMFERDLPEEYRRIFYDINRAEMSANVNSAAGRLGSAVNLLNSAVDSRFKQAAFYASIDRQLIERTGEGVSTFLERNNSLIDLPESIRDKAVYDSLDFVFQKGYSKKEGGGIANFFIKLHKDAPFVVSGFLGIPFPRYVANHMEFINDYTPIGLITGGPKKFSDNVYSGELKDVNERWARQLTGVTLFSGAVYARASQVEFNEEGEAVRMKTSFSDMQFGEEGETAKLGRVAGPLAAHQLLGDLYVRWKYDLPVPKPSALISDTLEVAAGLGNMGFGKGLVSDIQNAIDTGEFGSLGKRLADIGATFTYPTTVLRDVQGQINPELGYTPYTRNLMLGDNVQKEYNLLEAMITDTESINRLVRFLPETELKQYTQSFNGETSTVIMNPFSGGPVRAVNPLTKQILGIEMRTAPTRLQKEINTLGLKEYRLYSKSRLKNSATDYLVRYALTGKMPMAKEFEEEISQPLKAYGGTRSWEDLNKNEKIDWLERFVNNKITAAESAVDLYFEDLANKSPRAAATYLRNVYEIERKSKSKDLFNKAVTELTGGEFDNPDDYINDSSSIEQELERKENMIRVVDLMDSRIRN